MARQNLDREAHEQPADQIRRQRAERHRRENRVERDAEPPAQPRANGRAAAHCKQAAQRHALPFSRSRRDQLIAAMTTEGSERDAYRLTANGCNKQASSALRRFAGCKAAARPVCFVVSSLGARRTSSVLSRASLRDAAHPGLLATLCNVLKEECHLLPAIVKAEAHRCKPRRRSHALNVAIRRRGSSNSAKASAIWRTTMLQACIASAAKPSSPMTAMPSAAASSINR